MMAPFPIMYACLSKLTCALLPPHPPTHPASHAQILLRGQDLSNKNWGLLRVAIVDIQVGRGPQGVPGRRGCLLGRQGSKGWGLPPGPAAVHC
jgi:hypothetical protein